MESLILKGNMLIIIILKKTHKAEPFLEEDMKAGIISRFEKASNVELT